MNGTLMWAWAFKNSICVICWTVLAVLFNKWWILFFSLLFMSGLETVHKSYRICDKCGKHSPYANNYNDALDAAKKAGWVHFAATNTDYCPDCQTK